MFRYNAAKVILIISPLCKNEYFISDTQKLPSILSSKMYHMKLSRYLQIQEKSSNLNSCNLKNALDRANLLVPVKFPIKLSYENSYNSNLHNSKKSFKSSFYNRVS